MLGERRWNRGVKYLVQGLVSWISFPISRVCPIGFTRHFSLWIAAYAGNPRGRSMRRTRWTPDNSLVPISISVVPTCRLWDLVFCTHVDETRALLQIGNGSAFNGAR